MIIKFSITLLYKPTLLQLAKSAGAYLRQEIELQTKEDWRFYTPKLLDLWYGASKDGEPDRLFFRYEIGNDKEWRMHYKLMTPTERRRYGLDGVIEVRQH